MLSLNRSSNVKGLLAIGLVGVSAVTLFVPVAPGSDDVKSMFVMLTALAVRDYFGGIAQEKAVEAVKQAYDPSPGTSYIEGEGPADRRE